eukprot:9479867-Ditylum_brightwellii.AAC.1
MDSPITGIKDHGIKLPVEIAQMVMLELKDYLENKGIGGGELREAQVMEMIDTAANKFVGALDTS